MKFETFVKTVVKRLNNTGFDYAITGAVAVSYYGTPRTTTDLDIQVKLPRGQRRRFLTTLKKNGFRFDLHRAERALASGYNIVTMNDESSPFSLDLIITSRNIEGRPGRLLGINTFYQPPERLILAKLRMIKATSPPERTQKDREDIKSVLKYAEVDLSKLRSLASRERTINELEKLLTSL